MNELLKHTGEKLLPAVAYGDAAGLPVETFSAERIQEEYGYINQLVPATKNPFFKIAQEIGTWSDDTQLSMAVSEALIEADGFELDTQVQAHIDEYHRTPQVEWKGEMVSSGWGKSTQRSVERLIAGISPHESGEKGGAGNGIIMKMAPLVFWQVARNMGEEDCYAQYDELTRMTHDSDIAVAATRLHGDVLRHLLHKGLYGFLELEEFADYIIERSCKHDSFFQLNGELATPLQYLEGNDEISPSMILANTDGKGFFVPQTLAMAYGAFLNGAPDFEETVYGAVNLGGDTDSIASIVAAMHTFASAGDFEFPADAEQLNQRMRLDNVSRALARAALS